MADSGKGEIEDGDSRLDFMSGFVLKALRLKADKWLKMIQGDEKNVLSKFFETPTLPMIAFHVNHMGLLQPYIGYCSTAKGKMVYFIRNTLQLVTKDNVRHVLIVGELSQETIAELTILTEEIFTPLLCNPRNHQGWPELVIEDVKKHVYSFKNVLYQIHGDMNSQVLLPMPAGVEKMDSVEAEWINSCGDNVDLYLKTNIEGVIIQWASQINSLLKEESSVVFKKNPFALPIVDINYWCSRMKNLEGVYSQLKDPRVRKMATYLEMTNSVYLQCFKTMLTNLIAGVVEARDIVLHQKPLIYHFETFENTNFLDSRPLIRPMLHCIGLLWGNSQYYCTTDKITVLLQEVCNMLIEKCSASCEPSTIFFGEAIEQVIKIQDVLGIIDFFVETYEMNKAKVATFFPPESVPIMWTFDFNKVFSRLVKFRERLKMVEEVLKTTVEMLKLEKVEYSGIRGKTFSANTSLIYDKYIRFYQKMYQIQYNPLEPEDDAFLVDYKKFVNKVTDIDQRLAKIFGEAFDDCGNLEAMFKFIQILGDLLHRPCILVEIQPRFDRLVSLLEQELQVSKNIFQEGKRMCKRMKTLVLVIDAYYPPVAGVLWWIYKLNKRISRPLNDFVQMDETISLPEAASSIQEKYNAFLNELTDYENELYSKWTGSIPIVCTINMNKNLLTKENNLLKLNFDDELTCLLREVRYIQFLEKYEIPQEALDLYLRNEALQNEIMKLNRGICWYNNIRKGSHDSEVALIEREINKVDELLVKGLQELTWNDDIVEYVGDVFVMINKLQERVLTAQRNLKTCFDNMKLWSTVPLYDRHRFHKGSQPKLLALEDNAARKSKRLSDINTSYAQIKDVIEINYNLFFDIPSVTQEQEYTKDEISAPDDSEIQDSEAVTDEDAESEKVAESKPEELNENKMLISAELSEEEKQFREEHWSNYVLYVDSKVSEMIVESLTISMGVFVTNMDLERGPNIPFMEVAVHLQEPDLIFVPSLDEEDEECLQVLINQMVEDILMQAEVFKRIKDDLGMDNYSDAIVNNEHLKKMEIYIKETINYTIEDIICYIQIYNKYSYLWLDDRQEFLSLFLRRGKVITRENLDEIEQEDIEEDMLERPSLEVFKEQIEVFESLYKECDKLPLNRLFSGWLQLNMKHLKQALLNLVCKWGNLFKENLAGYVHNSLNDMENFIEQSVNSLSIELSENDYEGLLGVMACLAKVRDKQELSTQEMFDPIRDIIEILKTYGVEFPEEFCEQLEVLPEKWKNLTTLAALVKHNVGSLQTKYAQIITKQVTHFNHQLQLYRNDFKMKKFFYINCPDVYTLIDKTHHELLHFEDIATSLGESCGLFDVLPPDTKSILTTRRELKMAKQLWDYYQLVEWTIEDWKKTPWKKIDAESMDMECKRFTKDLRGLDKEMRTWEPYLAIEGIIKNLLTSLRAVTELQNPAIRDRHWIELMQATKPHNPDGATRDVQQSFFTHSSAPHPITSLKMKQRDAMNSLSHTSSSFSRNPLTKHADKVQFPFDQSQTLCTRAHPTHRPSKRKYSLSDFDLDSPDSKDSFEYKYSQYKKQLQKNCDYPYIFCEHFN